MAINNMLVESFCLQTGLGRKWSKIICTFITQLHWENLQSVTTENKNHRSEETPKEGESREMGGYSQPRPYANKMKK